MISDRDLNKNQRAREPTTISGDHRIASMISLIRRMIDAGVHPESIKRTVKIENYTRCDPPLTDSELEKQVFPVLNRQWISLHPYYAEDSQADFEVLPVPVPLNSIFEDMPPLKPVLIEGILRQGHKLLLSAPSKSGKSFLLLELAVAIAEGMKWLGNQCKRGKILYLNFEIEASSFAHRLQAIYERLQMDYGTHTENIIVWNLRGYSRPIGELVQAIIDQAKAEGCIAIILDPIYKIMGGSDENSNSDIAQMVSSFDRIARETAASIAYAHHFSKGVGGDKLTIDRASGAGTFTRDPDAIVTMTKLDAEQYAEDKAYRVEYILREFPDKKPYDVVFDYPIHEYKDYLSNCEIETSASNAAKRMKKANEARKEDRHEDVQELIDQCIDDPDHFTNKEFYLAWKEFYEEDIAPTNADRWLQWAGYEYISFGRGKTGYWTRKKNSPES